MSMKYLGESFDIHTGAVDNIFPHHENEIAQSEAATGRPFVRYWLHCAHLIVEGRKMSKSEGNFYTLRDLLQRGCSGRALRYLLLATHYRKQLNFTLEGVGQAQAAVDRLDDFRDRVGREAVADGEESLSRRIDAARQAFDAALDDDLNSSEALAAVFELVRDANSAYDRGAVRTTDAEGLLRFLGEVEDILGLGSPPPAIVDADIEALIEERDRARRERDYARADAIRAELLGQGIVLEDTPQGMRWKRR